MLHGQQDVTNRLERLDAFEERVGVRLEALYAVLDLVTYGQPTVTVRGEVHPTNGTALKASFRLVVGIHDATGRLIATEEQSFDEDSFFGFESFQMNLFLPTEDFTRLRVYPKAL